MSRITLFFEWLYEKKDSLLYGDKIYYLCLWCYQHIKLLYAKIDISDEANEGCVQLYYKHELNNFGDNINEVIMEYFRIKYRRSKIFNANLICIGSLMEDLLYCGKKTLKFKNCICIIGTGFIRKREDKNEKFNRPVNIYALRGKESLKRCEDMLGDQLQNVVLGDPGLLIRYTYANIGRKIEYDVGIILHKKDIHSTNIKNIILKNKKFVFIDICGQTEEIVKKINKCGIVLSSALHGIVCADAYGIPNQWIIVSGYVEGGDYKFRDYYSVYKNGADINPIDLRSSKITDEDVDILSRNFISREDEVNSICENLHLAFRKYIQDNSEK